MTGSYNTKMISVGAMDICGQSQLALSKTIDSSCPVPPDVHFNKQDHLIWRMKRDGGDLHNPTSRSIACLILME